MIMSRDNSAVPASVMPDKEPQEQRRRGHAYRAARRFEEALRQFEAAAQGIAKIYGANHPKTLRYRSSLANCHYAAGQTETAIRLFRELLAARRAALGERHPDTLRSRGSLANALHTAGRFAEAAALHRHNAGERENHLGPDHPSTQASQRNLARAMAEYELCRDVPDGPDLGDGKLR